MTGEQTQFIEALGDGTAVAVALSELLGRPIDRARVYKWKEHDHVPAKWRPALTELARRQGVTVPAAFASLDGEGLRLRAGQGR